MRLIDADVLRKTFENACIYGLPMNELYGAILKIIDNAPTVFTCNACKNIGNERECIDCHDYSNYVHYEERPQGEWIIKPKENSQSAILICNKCNHFIQITMDKNYCPNCGAEMKNGEES